MGRHLLRILLIVLGLTADGRGVELRGGVEPAMERVHGLLRADDGGARVLQDEHGQVVGIGIGHVEQLAVHVDRGGEPARIDDLHQRVGDGLGAETRGDRIQTKSGDRRLGHARRGARGMLLHLLLRGCGGDRHGTGQIVGRGQDRQILLGEPQADARLVAQLQAVRGEILPLRLRGILGLARLDGDAHGGELGAVALELLGEGGLGRLVGQFTVGIGIRLDALRDLAGGQPLREGRRQHCQHVKLMLAPLVGETTSSVATLCHSSSRIVRVLYVSVHLTTHLVPY